MAKQVEEEWQNEEETQIFIEKTEVRKQRKVAKIEPNRRRRMSERALNDEGWKWAWGRKGKGNLKP